MTTIDHKIALLEKYGFTIGERDDRLNTDYTGNFMVVEATSENIEDYELPSRDGANGPWCVVGDNLVELVDNAHEYLLDMADAHNGIEKEWQAIQSLSADDLPARRFTSLHGLENAAHPS